MRFREGGKLFNYVAGHFDLEDFESNRTQIVFIGRDLPEEVREVIRANLRECEV